MRPWHAYAARPDLGEKRSLPGVAQQSKAEPELSRGSMKFSPEVRGTRETRMAEDYCMY